MTQVYEVPGVYVEEDNALALSIQSGETAVPVFIGHFDAISKAPEGCVAVESWLAFTKLFSTSEQINIDASGHPASPLPTDHAGAFSVRLYFENGGGPCYVYNLLSKDRTSRSFSQMTAAIEQRPDITLLVWCETTKQDAEVYGSLGTLLGSSATPGGNSGRFLLADAKLKEAEPKPDLPRVNTDLEVPAVVDATQMAVYFPALRTNYVRELSDFGVKVTGLVFLPKLKPEQKRQYGLPESGDPTLAQLKSTLALVMAENPPDDPDAHDLKAAVELASLAAVEAVSEATAKINKTLADGRHQVVVRASAAMAGVIARVDRERGVWKAPANVELVGVQELVDNTNASDALPIRIDHHLNETLVKEKINAIRYFSGRGILAWGARTATDPTLTKWLYIPVRRLFNSVERDARSALRAAVFEPNSAPTWEVLRSALENYLHALWRKGALVGATADEAYFVHIGLGSTMTLTDIKQGKMIVKIGLAAVRPAEFIILELAQEVRSA